MKLNKWNTLATFILVTIMMGFGILSFKTNMVAFADDYAEQISYQIEFEDGDKIFVMYPYTATSNDDYLKSGLYYNKEPFENIYLINTSEKPHPQYFYQNELIFTKDGTSFARLPWTVSEFKSLEGIAIEFYTNGSMIKQYKVGELAFNKSKLEYSVSHVNWEKRSLRSYDPESNVLSITALDGTTTEFDLTSGEMSSRSPGACPFFISGITIICCIFFAIFFIKVRKKQAQCVRKN